MSEKNYYIECVHNAPITCIAKDTKSNKVLLEKKFYPVMTEKWTGKTISTGFTKLTGEEYQALSKYSKGFIHYKDNPKKTLASPLLVLHDDLPPEAKSPHEALADARRERREAAKQIETLNAEITRLKADLLDVREQYRALESASTDAEKLKPLNDLIADLAGKNGRLAGFAENMLGKLGELAANSKLNAGDVKQFIESFNNTYKALLEEKKDFE